MDGITATCIYVLGIFVCLVVTTIVYKATGESMAMDAGVPLSFGWVLVIPVGVAVGLVWLIWLLINLCANLIMSIFKIKMVEPREKEDYGY